MNNLRSRRNLLTLLCVSMPSLVWADAQAVDAPEISVPRYLLMNGAGRAVTSEDFKGRFQLIAFGYTGCPDVCPTTLLEMQQILESLGTRAKHLQAIFISIDPQRDTSAVLTAYTQNFDSRILGLSGNDALIRRAASSFNVKFEKIQEPGADTNAYTMDHSVGMFLLDPDGSLITRFAYSTPVKDVLARISHWLKDADK